MRRIALAAAMLGAAATLFSTAPASAVCIEAWQTVTGGQCSPCTTVGAVGNRVEDKTGVDVFADMNCLA